MKQQLILIKNILINRTMFNGKKQVSENLILKCFKTLSKNSKKQQKKIIKLFLINILPIFKLHKSSNKKVKKKKRKLRITPFFILKFKNRISFGIKIMLNNLKKKENNYFSESLTDEILLSANNESYGIEKKCEIQKTALETKRYIKYF